jgi:hypothetical protein
MPRSFEPSPDHPAVGALVKLHAHLGGQLLENRKQAKRITDEMKHVEAVIRMFQPGYDVRRIAVKRRKRNPIFRRGTLLRHALDVLRAAEGPLTTREIALAMLAAQGVAEPDNPTVRNIAGSVKASLRHHKGVAIVGEGMPARWALVE